MRNRALSSATKGIRLFTILSVMLISNAVQGSEKSTIRTAPLRVTDFLPLGYATDGSACYQQHLQRAIDQAVKSQRAIVFPAMVYRIDDPRGLKISSGLSLELTGAKFIFHEECSVDGQVFYGENVADVKFVGGEIVGHNNRWRDGVNIRGIYLKGQCRRIRIRDMHLHDLSSNGIGIFGTSDELPAKDVWITDTIIERCCNRYGDYQAPAGELRGPEKGSRREDQGSVAMYYVHDFVVRGCRMVDSRSDGTHFYHCRSGQIVDNKIYRAKMGGYFIETCQHVLASGNVIRDNGSRGCTIERDSRFCTLQGNTVEGSGREGLWIPNCDRCVVTGNQFIRNGRKTTGTKRNQQWNANITINTDPYDPTKADTRNYLISNNLIDTSDSQIAAIRVDTTEPIANIVIRGNVLLGENQRIVVEGPNKTAVQVVANVTTEQGGNDNRQALAKPSFQQPDAKAHPDLFVWNDTCNVYVLRDGDSALLIDLGTGSVLDHLKEIGIKRVEWVLFTHHHREQCQGIVRIDRAVTKVAAPKAEQELFEKPTQFRKWFPKLGDKYSVYGASYARPPRLPIPLDQALAADEVFKWRGHQIRCLSTPGHSPGSMTYVTGKQGGAVAFSGGMIHDGAKMTTWFDTEWDYGFAKGIDTLIASVKRLSEESFALVLPSAGPAIKNPQAQLKTYEQKLTTFRKSYIRGYNVFESTEKERDSISKPTKVPLISQVTPHLYKLSHKTKGKNFAIIISDRGHGLILDAGLFPEAMLDEIILGLREHMGLKKIDAFWISHMHGDHFLLGPTLKKKYGAEAWTLQSIADKCEHPRRYDYSALVSAYGDGFDGMKIEKPFRDGETVEWEGYKIQVDWMPGQTEFGCCLWLEIDGKRIAFTGDNLFGNPDDKTHDGHEAVVARNSAILEEGYILGSRYLKNLKPDIVMGSHSYVMHNPAAFLGRYHEWSKRMLALYQDMLPDEDYQYQFDPYWVSAYPYRIDLNEQDQQQVIVTVRNHRNASQRHHVKLRLPPGVTAEPAVLEGTVASKSRRSYPVKLTVDRTKVPQGVQMVTFDITLDGKHYGEMFDFLVRAKE